MATTTDLLALTRWQLDLTWSLAELHLADLTDEDLLWEPADHCWTVHLEADGRWRPDWQVPEPEPFPVPTVGWVTWQLGWWWTTLIDHLQRRTPPDRTDVTWPGDAESTVRWLRGLHDTWRGVLEELTEADLEREAPFPWPAGSGLTIAHTLTWANAELMKNIAEIGSLKILRRAGGAHAG